MQGSKLFFRGIKGLLFSLCSLNLMAIYPVQAIPAGQGHFGQNEGNAIIGQVNEGDLSFRDEPDETDDIVPLKNSRPKLKAKKKADEKSPPLSDALRTKINKGFDNFIKFHENWFNQSPRQVSAGLEKLIKFCNFACTRNTCTDKEIANNCHLVCPESTTDNCPDPLKAGDKNQQTPSSLP